MLAHQTGAWLAAILLALFITEGNAAEPDFDLVITGGKIVDGSGAPWFYGDLAIRGDRIVEMGKIAAERGQLHLDASGYIVAPGFIDIHSHSDYLLLENGNAESKTRQGVTTEILGEGSSAGPFQDKLAPREIALQGKSVHWRRLGEYFDLLEQHPASVNVASYVGLNNIWRSVLGDAFDAPTEAQLAAMDELVDEAMQDGALGLSSQVMMPPGSLVTTEQIIRFCRIVSRHGGIYSTHIRNEGDGVFDSVAEAIRIAKEADLPVDIIHLKIADQVYWGRMEQIVETIAAARSEGANVQANVYPYTRGNNNLVSIIPPWAHEGGRGRLLERLRDATLHERLKRDIREGIPGWYNHYTAVGADWSRMLVSGNNRFQGLTMDRVMSLRTDSRDPDQLLSELFEFLIEEGGSVSTVYAHHTEADMNLALSQPWCSVGSDGSAYSVSGPLRRGNPHPRNFGTFPRVLGVYARERGLLRLEEAIRKMTWLNARKVGLRQRGLLAVGFFADITVFDQETVKDQATYTDPFQYPVGIEHVVVNGKMVLRGGEHTDARPGRPLRHQIPTADSEF